MAKSKNCFKSNYFLILVLLVFFMLLYVYIGGPMSLQKRVEMFVENKLLPADNLVVVQGNGIPNVPIEPSEYDKSDDSSPIVDGTEKGARSKFFFAYNECKPECCKTSGGYSCNGGCPCVTQEQMKYAYSRGNNSRHKKCAYDSERDY